MQGLASPRVAWWLKCPLIILLLGLLSACGLPSIEDRSVSQAWSSDETRETALGKGLFPQVQAHFGMSGILPLSGSLDAFAARMSLIAEAQKSLDIQYYIWRDDITGNLMLKALLDAARRNVRVRLLLDDNGVSGLDEKLAMLNAEPNLEVRLFNPFPFRKFKPLGFLFDFSRLNRRMHNKSFTVDGQVTVVGGRNIGDEYFGATQGVAFADLDVLAAGAVVDEVSKDFDRYWNSASAYPLEVLVPAPDDARRRQLEEGFHDVVAAPSAQAYVEATIASRYIEALSAGSLVLEWVPVRMVSDDPGKVLGQAPPETLLLARLNQVLDAPQKSVDLISPYFVPTQAGAEAFVALANQGVKLRILTNALEATDVTAVHAGYSQYRKALLKEGIALYEMRRQGNQADFDERAGPFGSSGSSLHAKTFSVDSARVFVGSFNFDPRSARLNTELGFVISSANMAETIAAIFDTGVSDRAYELGLDAAGDIFWIEHGVETSKKLTREPSTPLWKVAYVRFLSWLPIESLL